MSPILLFHICTATIGLLSAVLALSFRKGSGLHGAAGTVFFVSMLGMSASGAWLAAFVRPVIIHVVVGLLTFYLVATGWRATVRRDGRTGAFDVCTLLLALLIAAFSWRFGFEAANNHTGMKDGIPAAFYFSYGSLALLFAIADMRMLILGGYTGSQRIARHVWRMCTALLIATVSLFPQQRLLAQLLRDSSLLWLPHFVLIASLIYWLVRISIPSKDSRNRRGQANRTATTGRWLKRASDSKAATRTADGVFTPGITSTRQLSAAITRR